jgi:hypothetical protein
VVALAYAVCFLALAAVSGLAVASGPRWLLRLPLLAATPVLAIGVWWQLSQRDGWPTGARPADGSTFVGGVVQAPTPDSAGAIFLWAQPPNSATPRSYRLPYSRQLEQQLAQAARQAKRGVAVRMRKATRVKGRTVARAERSALQFYRLAPAQVEVKRRR